MILSRIGMAAAAALICTAAHAETVAPVKPMQLAQAKPAPAACTLVYLPVCGSVKGKQTDFSNDCEAKRAKAKNITPGRCTPKA
jgi:hypothetical protein